MAFTSRLFFLIIMLCVHAGAQPAFLPGDEIPIPGAVVHTTPMIKGHEVSPCIAVHDNRAVWITWPGGMQWFTPDLQFDGPLQPGDSYQLATPCPSGSWAKIEDSSRWDTQWRFFRNFYFRIYQSMAKTSRTDILFSEMDVVYPTEIGEFDRSKLEYIDGYSTTSMSHFVSMSSREFNNSGVSGADMNTYLRYWDHTTATISNIPLNYARFFDPDTARDISNAIVSRIRDGIFGVYQHSAILHGPKSSENYTYQRSIALYHDNATVAGPIIVIDTLSPVDVDFSDRIALGRWRDLFLLHLDATKTEVVAEHFTPTGTLIARPPLGIPNIRRHGRSRLNRVPLSPLDMDLEIAHISGDRYIMAWSALAVDSTFDVYVAVFDSSMTMVGLPKRLNANVAGNQYEVQLAVKGDTVFAVWLTAPDGHSGAQVEQVTLRVFTPGQILTVKQPPVPDRNSLAIYPAPIRDHLTLVTSEQWRNDGIVEILDLLGRVRQSVPLTGGTLTLPCNNLNPGVYQLRLSGSGRTSTTKFVVVR